MVLTPGDGQETICKKCQSPINLQWMVTSSEKWWNSWQPQVSPRSDISTQSPLSELGSACSPRSREFSRISCPWNLVVLCCGRFCPRPDGVVPSSPHSRHAQYDCPQGAMGESTAAPVTPSVCWWHYEIREDSGHSFCKTVPGRTGTWHAGSLVLCDIMLVDGVGVGECLCHLLLMLFWDIIEAEGDGMVMNDVLSFSNLANTYWLNTPVWEDALQLVFWGKPHQPEEEPGHRFSGSKQMLRLATEQHIFL